MRTLIKRGSDDKITISEGDCTAYNYNLILIRIYINISLRIDLRIDPRGLGTQLVYA
jgi:hypothetical protein